MYDYNTVVDTISHKSRFMKACGREVMEALLPVLNHPEAGLRIAHIAGTNGKGSTAAFLSSIMTCAMPSEKIGLFTSPHLVDFAERIMINGQPISHDDVARIGSFLLELKLDGGIELTMFDYTLAMALIYFKEQGVNYAVIETGLGGAKDSTSGLAITPVVSVITSIGLEHTAILGDTIVKIASEKAGIIKPGTKVVIGQMDADATGVFENKCRELDVPLYIEDTPVDANMQLGLIGKYQRYNAAVAIRAAQLMEVGAGDDAIARGLKNARWPGRMEIVSTEPFMLLDGAHNPQGIKALCDSLKDAYPNEKFTFVVSILTDKDYKTMVEELSGLAAEFFVAKLEYERGLDIPLLCVAIANTNSKVMPCFTIKEALDEAVKTGRKVIVCGSLYFIGAVKEILQ